MAGRLPVPLAAGQVGGKPPLPWTVRAACLPWLCTLLAALPAQAGMQVPLECQLAGGDWQSCTLTVERLGEHWWLQVAGRRLDFRSDGRGSVTLSEPGGRSRAVQPVWTSEQALCWDGVCTKGDLPLD